MTQKLPTQKQIQEWLDKAPEDEPEVFIARKAFEAGIKMEKRIK